MSVAEVEACIRAGLEVEQLVSSSSKRASEQLQMTHINSIEVGWLVTVGAATTCAFHIHSLSDLS